MAEMKKPGKKYRRLTRSSRTLCLTSIVIRAIETEDILQLKAVLKSESSFGCPVCCGSGPYHAAISYNNTELLDYLVFKDRNYINQQDFKGETPLLRAIKKRKFDLVEKLIAAGAYVNISNDVSMTPLHAAVRYPEVAHLLIEYGADINARNGRGGTPLHCAVECNEEETVCMLLYYNADVTILNSSERTPFMEAIIRHNNKMQEILFEYVEDYDFTPRNCCDSLFCMALKYNSLLVEEMIIRGANVDKVCALSGAYGTALKHIKAAGSTFLNIFKLVWEKMSYQPAGLMSVLNNWCLYDNELFYGVIDIFIECNKLPIIVESLYLENDFCRFIEKCIDKGLPLEKFSTFLHLILSYGYIPNEGDLMLIFKYWGYCEPFRILLHMEISQEYIYGDLDNIPSLIIHDMAYSTNALLNELSNYLTEYCHDDGHFTQIVILRILDFCVFPSLINVYLNNNKTDCVTMKIRALPKVPSLVELARNETREHLKKSFNVERCSTLYTVIHNLDIADDYKKILTFETVIYKPTFTKLEFERFVKLVKMTKEKRQVTNLVINSALKNSIYFDKNVTQRFYNV